MNNTQGIFLSLMLFFIAVLYDKMHLVQGPRRLGPQKLKAFCFGNWDVHLKLQITELWGMCLCPSALGSCSMYRNLAKPCGCQYSMTGRSRAIYCKLGYYSRSSDIWHETMAIGLLTSNCCCCQAYSIIWLPIVPDYAYKTARVVRRSMAYRVHTMPLHMH